MNRLRKLSLAILLLSGGAGMVFAGLLWADRAFPPPLALEKGLSRQVIDRNGELLRAFAAPDGRWRLPVQIDDIDPAFLKMLIAYEDKRFYSHHGVDPRAILRATWQFISHGGRIVSGASTITMQLARLIEPRSERSLIAKLRQALRAIQIERRLDKEQILELYLTLAPYGGNLEGVRAASLAWFGREPKKLTLSQAALLVALPQSPETRRPDRYPLKARASRGRVLERMEAAGLLPAFEVARAGAATIPKERRNMPDLAAHMADTALNARPAAETVSLTIDASVQARLEKLAVQAGNRLGPKQSLAIILADGRTGEILASVGSTGYLDLARFGAIDMTRAVRSPGSALKPFIYGIAFDQALVAPETLIDDAPANFSGYRPENFDLEYQGEVTIREALQMSLNVPAVMLLEAVGPQRLVSRLKRGGVTLDLPPGNGPGLAIGLGGVGITLRDLVQVYTAFVNSGRAMPLRDGLSNEELSPPGAPLMGAGAAWKVSSILSDVPAPLGAPSLAIAYKTGTSYGYRDAWAVGFDGRHVLGVWVGRPDAAPAAGITGLGTAAPILFEAFARSGLALVPMPSRPPGTILMSRSELPFALRRFHRDGTTGGFADRGPEIVFPPKGARVELSRAGVLDPLVVKLEGGTAPYRWIANGEPLPKTTRRRHMAWLPDGPGASNLTVIDADGRAASVNVFIE